MLPAWPSCGRLDTLCSRNRSVLFAIHLQARWNSIPCSMKGSTVPSAVLSPTFSAPVEPNSTSKQIYQIHDELFKPAALDRHVLPRANLGRALRLLPTPTCEHNASHCSVARHRNTCGAHGFGGYGTTDINNRSSALFKRCLQLSGTVMALQFQVRCGAGRMGAQTSVHPVLIPSCWPGSLLDTSDRQTCFHGDILGESVPPLLRTFTLVLHQCRPFSPLAVSTSLLSGCLRLGSSHDVYAGICPVDPQTSSTSPSVASS